MDTAYPAAQEFRRAGGDYAQHMVVERPAVRSLLVKFGGSIAGGAGADPVLADLVEIARAGVAVTLVHGGGPAVDAELRSRGVATQRIAGLRVTDAATLAVVEAILGHEVNAAVAAAVGAAGGTAERVAGDAGVFIAAPLRHPDGDLGFVGEIAGVDPGPVRDVLARGRIPVVSPIGADAAGQRYNINADTAAGALAAALGVDAYVAVTDVARVRRERGDPTTGIARMTLAEAEAYRSRGVFVDGMRPKIDAALDAIRGGVPRAFICGAGLRAVSSALAGDATEIVS